MFILYNQYNANDKTDTRGAGSGGPAVYKGAACRSSEEVCLGFQENRSRARGEWFEKMTGTDDLYEFRVTGRGTWHRLLAFWDKTGDVETLIVACHGFDKKTNKTPAKEIERAEQAKRKHFKN